MQVTRFLTRARVLALAIVVAGAGVIGLRPLVAGAGGTDDFVQTNLVSNINGMAQQTDPNLKNPWGMSNGPGGPIWVSDNNAGVSTLYDGNGNPFPPKPNGPLVVSIPAAGGGAGSPTGQAFNTFDPKSTDFIVSKGGISGPAFFIFATEDGTISGWNPSVDKNNAVLAVDRSNATDTEGDSGAVYKGLTLVSTNAGKFLFATNFRFGTVEVFDTHFNLVNVFTDPELPSGYAPFGIDHPGGKLLVTFAKQKADKHDDAAGAGRGFVDVFNANGKLLHRLISGGKLNSPWGLALAPSSFGKFSGDLLVGNFGDGRINAYEPGSGDFEGTLKDTHEHAITIDGLWGLRFGTGGLNGPTTSLFFTAGINGEADGLFGTLVPSH
jgi:uncharacterized protein (TIGR03118 family)